MNGTNIFFIIFFIISGCKTQKAFDKQAHRGGAGLMPENTILSAKNALSFGATIEMDLYMSKDSQLIVTHDPHVVSLYALYPDGNPVLKEDETELVLSQMNYDEIKMFEIGLKPHPTYPQQNKISAYIPLFSNLIDSAEIYARLSHLKSPRYNIQAGPAYTITDSFRSDFIKKLMKIVLKKNIQKRSMFQAFDLGMLEIMHRDYPGEIKISYLVSKNDLETNLKKLTFLPDIYSPYYKLITKELVDQCHQKKMKIIPWTVNTKEEIEQLRAMNVDGIISDYPNYFN